MTPLNTIIEEENDALERKIGDFTFNNGGALELTLWDIVDERVHETNEVGIVIQDHLTTAIQRAVEYERARIRESFDDWFKNSTQDVEDWTQDVEDWADRNLPTSQGQISR